MENPPSDKDLLRQERKERKKLKKSMKQSMQISEKGIGLNKHTNSKKPIEVSIESLTKPKEPQREKSINKRQSEVEKYLGNPLDSSHPERFRGKHREEPKLKKPSRLKSEIIKCEQKRDKDVTERINYCNNLITPELNKSAENYIRKVVQLYKNAISRDDGKKKIKKRYVCGFSELKKKLIINKIKCFVIAIDVNVFDESEVFVELIGQITTLAESKSVPYAFALKRSKLGNLCRINRPVSCVGILNHQGAEHEFERMLEQVVRLSSDEGDKPDDDVLKKLIEIMSL